MSTETAELVRGHKTVILKRKSSKITKKPLTHLEIAVDVLRTETILNRLSRDVGISQNNDEYDKNIIYYFSSLESL